MTYQLQQTLEKEVRKKQANFQQRAQVTSQFQRNSYQVQRQHQLLVLTAELIPTIALILTTAVLAPLLTAIATVVTLQLIQEIRRIKLLVNLLNRGKQEMRQHQSLHKGYLKVL